MERRSQGRPRARVIVVAAVLGLMAGACDSDRIGPPVGPAGTPAAPAPVPPAPPAPPAPLLVSGTVFADGRPLENATVDVRGKIVATRTQRFGVTGTTDAAGRYEVKVPNDASLTVWVTGYHNRFQFQPCAAWFEQTAPATPPQQTVDLHLIEPAALSTFVPVPRDGRRTVSGTIYRMFEGGRQAVAGAVAGWDESSDDYKAMTRADAEGRFTLCGLPVNQRLNMYGQDRMLQGWTTVEPGGDAAIEIIVR